MYFHLIWIKEKNWEKYDLDILLQWWDEDFIRKFLWYRGVVIVSINQFKEDPKTFWNILISISFDDSKIQIVAQWDDFNERMYFFMFLWLEPLSMNLIENPIPEDQMKELLHSTLVKIQEEDEKVKELKELEELNEQKKYEESWIKDWLRIINSNIVRIEQVLKAWQWIISWTEMKELEDYLNEMKKIRLWTNFNKMAALVLDAHLLLRKTEEEIFNNYDSKKFFIDENSSATNIDVLREYLHSDKVSEKAVFQPAWLTLSENVANALWYKSVFLKLLGNDIASTFKSYSIDETFSLVMNLVEYIVLTIIIVISLIWLFWNVAWMGNFSLYLLPAMWWLWLLIYLFNSLNPKWPITKIVWFAVLALIYWRGLILLLNTFAL